MSNFDLVHNIDSEASITSQLITADTNGTGIDLSGYLSATAIVIIGAEGPNLSANISISLKLQDSDDDAAWTDVEADATLALDTDDDGVFYTAAKAADAPAVVSIGYRMRKRYLRVVIDVKGAQGTGTPIAALIVKGHPTVRPA